MFAFSVIVFVCLFVCLFVCVFVCLSVCRDVNCSCFSVNDFSFLSMISQQLLELGF